MKNPNKTIDELLYKYKKELGRDFEKYRNHVYRIFSFCLKMDNEKQNEEKYAIASFFHDIGIWTNNTFDYLEPSIILANTYLKQIGKLNWKDEIELMVDMHHKISKYSGTYENTVETFRKSDWIDVTKGLKLFGLEKSDYNRIAKDYPLLGFHKFLIIQTLKNFIKSPLNPLPMFKK